MARLVEAGADVRYVAFSIATRSLPEGFPPDTLAREVREATAELGIPAENLTVHDFDVRTFPEHRQEILELLIELWNDWQPDLVFQPSLHDIHQDHQTIAAGGPARVQADDDPRLRDPVEQLRLRLPGVLRARASARRAQGRRAREVRLAAAPPLRERRVRLEPRPHARHQREPRVRRGVPGVPRDRLKRRRRGGGRVERASTAAVALAAVAAGAAAATAPPAYTLRALHASLFYNDSGTFSPDIPPNAPLFNTIIGEGWAAEPSSATLVRVTVGGARGSFAPNRSVQLVVRNGRTAAGRFGGEPSCSSGRRISASSPTAGRRRSASGSPTPGCVPLKLTAALRGQPRALSSRG